ncbi:MAG TPA: hypothetical protein VHA79_08205 [Mycobacteriales bacterium]|nr:hypothetical protein [Mycobacteriales bacterium]
MTTEDKFVFVMAGFSVLLLVVGHFISKILASAHPKVMRTVWPIAAALTGACYATIVYIARYNVKG